LLQPLEEVAEELAEDHATPEELHELLVELRRLIHPALGASDLRECLLLQLDASGVDSGLVRTMVEAHLDDITTNRLPRIAKSTGRSIAEVKEALETIRALDPTPAIDHQAEPAAAILPDVVVEEVDGRWEVRLTRARIPELTISSAYKHLLRQARRGDGVQEWVKKRLESARWFIDAIVQRQSTLQRIATCIFERQRDFLDRGVKALRPLRMQEVADQVGVHISTVSRAVSGKYAQTPRGTYALKFFFTGGTPRETGGVASQASIKQRIRELVDQEDPTSPLSDDQLAEMLEQRDKVKIARRTVTKYRKALSIPASSQRRQF
jgi:RNA polymerase sigma-54 factor